MTKYERNNIIHVFLSNKPISWAKATNVVLCQCPSLVQSWSALIGVSFSLCGIEGQCQVNSTAIKLFSWAECWKWKKIKISLRIYRSYATPHKSSLKALLKRVYLYPVYSGILPLKSAGDKGKNVIVRKSFIVFYWLCRCMFADCNLLHNAGQVVWAAGERDKRVFSLSSPFLSFKARSLAQCTHHRMSRQGFLYWFLSISSNPWHFCKTSQCILGLLVLFQTTETDLKLSVCSTSF